MASTAAPAHNVHGSASQSNPVKSVVKEISENLNISGEDFVKEDFDVKEFTLAIIKTQQLTEHLAKLSLNINVLDKEIKDQVNLHHEDLLHQAINIETLEEMLDIVQTRISSLKSTSERLRIKITTPFNELNLRILQLSRLQAACDTLRRIKGILHHSAKLHVHMQVGVRDIVKSAQCLNELEFLLRDFDSQGIDIIENDVHFLHKSRHEVEEQAEIILDKSLLHHDQTQISTALQVFYSLGILKNKLSHVVSSSEKNFQKRLNELLDTTSLTLQSTNLTSSSSTNSLGHSVSSAQFPGRSNMPNVGSMSQFRANLWSNVEKIMDTLFDSCSQIYQLQQILEKKKDLLTNLYYIEEIEFCSLFRGKMYLSDLSNCRDEQSQDSLDNKKIISYENICSVLNTKELNAKKSLELLYTQWRSFTSILNSSILAACNQSNYIKQTFQNEYPKLLKLQNDLWLRLLQLNPLLHRYQYLDQPTEKTKLKWQEKPGYQSSYELLRKCFYDLENSYLNRSLSHLFDPINLIFSQNAEKHISRSDIETYVKGIQSQMQTLQYDICDSSNDGFISKSVNSMTISNCSSSFSEKVIANVCKSIQMYANKSEQVINTLNFEMKNNMSNKQQQVSTSTSVIDSTNEIQLRNLDYVNVTHDLYEQLRLMFLNDYRLNKKLTEKLSNSLKSLLSFEENALSPFISSVSDYILAIMLTMHQEDFTTPTPNACSLYIKELQQVLQRICRDYLQLFNCKSILNPFMNQLAIRCIDLFIRQASILRPMSDPTRKKLVNDSKQLETIIQTILCPKLTDLGMNYKQLKAFRHLLETSSPLQPENPSRLGTDVVDEAHYTQVLSESLPSSILLHYLFSYAPNDFKSPHQSLDWPVAKYTEWQDTHVSEKERLMVVKTCLEAYVNMVTQKNETQFATIYPLMFGLLEKSLESL